MYRYHKAIPKKFQHVLENTLCVFKSQSFLISTPEPLSWTSSRRRGSILLWTVPFQPPVPSEGPAPNRLPCSGQARLHHCPKQTTLLQTTLLQTTLPPIDYTALARPSSITSSARPQKYPNCCLISHSPGTIYSCQQTKE